MALSDTIALLIRLCRPRPGPPGISGRREEAGPALARLRQWCRGGWETRSPADMARERLLSRCAQPRPRPCPLVAPLSVRPPAVPRTAPAETLSLALPCQSVIGRVSAGSGPGPGARQPALRLSEPVSPGHSDRGRLGRILSAQAARDSLRAARVTSPAGRHWPGSPVNYWLWSPALPLSGRGPAGRRAEDERDRGESEIGIESTDPFQLTLSLAVYLLRVPPSLPPSLPLLDQAFLSSRTRKVSQRSRAQPNRGPRSFAVVPLPRSLRDFMKASAKDEERIFIMRNHPARINKAYFEYYAPLHRCILGRIFD